MQARPYTTPPDPPIKREATILPFPGEEDLKPGHSLTKALRPQDEGLAWHVCRTATRREHDAEASLIEAGYAVYLPRLTRWSRTGPKRKRVCQALFTGYLFVGLSPDQNLMGVEAVDRVHGILRKTGGAPQHLPFAELRKFLKLEQSGKFDKTRKRKDPEPGTPATVLSGAFEGRAASFLERRGDERVAVLMDILGGETVLLLDEAEVEVAGHASPEDGD